MLAGSFWMTAFQDTCIMNKYTCILFVIVTSIIYMYMHYMDTKYCRELENFSLLFEKLL